MERVSNQRRMDPTPCCSVFGYANSRPFSLDLAQHKFPSVHCLIKRKISSKENQLNTLIKMALGAFTPRDSKI